MNRQRARIELTEDNTEKLQKASPELNRSLNELANIIIESVDYVEIMTMVKVKLKKTEDINPEQTTKPRLIIRRASNTYRF